MYKNFWTYDHAAVRASAGGERMEPLNAAGFSDSESCFQKRAD